MKRKLILLLSAVVAFASCAKDDNVTPSTNSNEVSFTFGGIVTKVTGTEFDLGDEILVQAYNEDGSLFGVADYSYEGSSSFGSDNPFTFTSDVDKLSYLSVYPSDVTSESTTFTAVAESDQSVAANYEKSDVLAASIAATSSLSPELQFSHIMSNLTIMINVVNLEGLAVEYDDIAFKAILSQDCDIENKTYSATSGASAVSVTPKDMGSNIYSMVLASQTLLLNGDFASISVDGVEVNMPADSEKSVTLTSGYMDKFTWDITIDGGTVVTNTVTKIGGSIDEWGTTGGDSTTTDPEDNTGSDSTSGEDMLSAAGWDTGFEDSTKGQWMNFSWGGVCDMNTISRSSAQAKNGTYSTYFEIQENGGMAGGFRAADQTQLAIPVVSGNSYEVGFWIYIEAMPTDANLSIVFGDLKSAYTPVTELLTTSLNTWVYKTTTVVATGSDINDLLLFSTLESSAGGEFKFYIDDITMVDITSGGSTGDSGSSSDGDDLLVAAGWDASFEDSTIGFWKNFAAWGGIYANTVATSSTAQAHTGSYSTYIPIAANEGTAGSFRNPSNTSLPITVTAGESYTVGFWLYVDQMPSDANISIVLSDNNSSYIAVSNISEAMNTWVYKSVTLTAIASASSELILLSDLSACEEADFNFYIDDFTMVSNSSSGSTGDSGSTTTGDELFAAAGWDTSFEDSTIGFWKNFAAWGGIYANTTASSSTAQAHTGSYSTYIPIAANEGTVGSFRDPSNTALPISVTAGASYTVGFWLYVESMPADANLSIVLGSNNSNYADVGGVSDAVGTWVYKSATITATAAADSEVLLFCTLENCDDAAFNFYVDDFTMYAVE